jgi:hypothetical protein
MTKFGAQKKALLVLALFLSSAGAVRAEDENMRIIRQSLFGAGVGAISAEASGGKAGSGALIGAGTQVIGQALIGILTESPSAQHTYTPASSYAPSYSRTHQHKPSKNFKKHAPRGSSHHNTTYGPIQWVQPVYVYETKPIVVHQPAPAYYAQPAYGYAQNRYEDPNRRIIHQGLLGAGVGAISSYASGGKGGKGALIGAGSNIIGTALFEILTTR